MNTSLHAGPEVRACDLGPAIVLVSYRSGAVQVLTGPSREWWRKAARGEGVDESTPWVSRLLAKGLVGRGAVVARPWPLVPGVAWEPNWGTHELPMGFAPHPRVPLQDRVWATIALLVTVTTAVAGSRRRRMMRLVRLVNRVSRRLGRPASREQAARVVHAVRRVGMFSPLRTACLEQSVASAVGLALAGRSVRWCHGVSADPVTLHAWIEADGYPVAEADSVRRCAVLLALPPKEKNT